jgi:hypothetical protein
MDDDHYTFEISSVNIGNFGMRTTTIVWLTVVWSLLSNSTQLRVERTENC